MSYFVYIKNILGVKTNLDSLSWVYGSAAPKVSESEFETCKIKVYLDIRSTKNVFDEKFNTDEFDKYNYFYARKNENKIYYERNFFLNAKLRYSATIQDNTIHIVMNKNYYKFIHYRFMNLHSLGYLLTDLACGVLLQNGYAALHCSAVRIKDRTVVIFAPPDTGKTLTAIKLCENKDAVFISEDIAITDGTHIYGVPWTSTFRFYDHHRESKYNRFINTLRKKMPFLELVALEKTKSINAYLGSEAYSERAPITDIIVLGKGKRKIIQSHEGIFESILNLNKYEFNYHRSPTILVLNYFNPQIATDAMYKQEKALVRKMVNRSSACRVFAKSALEYSDLVRNSLVKDTPQGVFERKEDFAMGRGEAYESGYLQKAL